LNWQFENIRGWQASFGEERRDCDVITDAVVVMKRFRHWQRWEVAIIDSKMAETAKQLNPRSTFVAGK